MIKSITAKSIKGRSFAAALTPLTLVHGNNATGKTTVLQALRLALLGYDPSLGKTNKATFKLASGPEMAAGAKWESGESITRTWAAKSRSITSKTTGALPAGFDAVIIDGASFLDAKPAARGLMLRERFPSATDPKAEILAAIKAVDGFTALLNIKPTAAEDLVEWLDDLGDSITEQAKKAKALADQFAKTIAGISTLQLADATTPTGAKHRLEDAQAARDAARSALNKAHSELSQAEAQRASLRAELDRPEPANPEKSHAQLETELAAARHNLRECQDQEQRARATDQANKAARLAAERLEAELAQLELRITAQGRAPTSPREAMPPAPDLTGIQARYQAALVASSMATAAAKTAAQAAAAAKLASSTGVCACCEAPRSAWSEGKQAAEASALEAAEINARASAERAEAKAKAAAAIGEEKDKAEAITEARAVIATHNELTDRWQDRKAQAAAITATTGEDSEDIAQEIDNIECFIESTNQQLAAASAHERRAAAQAEAVAANEAHHAATERLEAAITATAAADANHAIAMEARHKAEAAAAEQARLAEAEAQRDEQRSLAEIYARMLAVLKAEGVRIAAQAMAPVLAIAQPFVDGLLPSPLASLGLEIGRWDGPRFIYLDTFSGSEKAVTICAIQAALAAASSSRFVVIDEFSQLDAARKQAFVNNLFHAIQTGALEQAIVFDNRQETEGFDSFLDTGLLT